MEFIETIINGLKSHFVDKKQINNLVQDGAIGNKVLYRTTYYDGLIPTCRGVIKEFDNPIRFEQGDRIKVIFDNIEYILQVNIYNDDGAIVYYVGNLNCYFQAYDDIGTFKDESSLKFCISTENCFGFSVAYDYLEQHTISVTNLEDNFNIIPDVILYTNVRAYELQYVLQETLPETIKVVVNNIDEYVVSINHNDDYNVYYYGNFDILANYQYQHIGHGLNNNIPFCISGDVGQGKIYVNTYNQFNIKIFDSTSQAKLAEIEDEALTPYLNNYFQNIDSPYYPLYFLTTDDVNKTDVDVVINGVKYTSKFKYYEGYDFYYLGNCKEILKSWEEPDENIPASLDTGEPFGIEIYTDGPNPNMGDAYFSAVEGVYNVQISANNEKISKIDTKYLDTEDFVCTLDDESVVTFKVLVGR